MKNVELENAIISKLRELSEIVVAADGSEWLHMAVSPDGYVSAFRFAEDDLSRYSINFTKQTYQSWDEFYAERKTREEEEEK